MYAVFKVQCWLMFYQPFKKKISFLLKSLVKPASILIRISPVFLFLIWRPPALPHRLQCSTIGRLGLNRRVRDGNGCCLLYTSRMLAQKQPSIQRVRNSSLVERSCAENVRGWNAPPKLRNRKVGRGALHAERSSTVRSLSLIHISCESALCSTRCRNRLHIENKKFFGSSSWRSG